MLVSSQHHFWVFLLEDHADREEDLLIFFAENIKSIFSRRKVAKIPTKCLIFKEKNPKLRLLRSRGIIESVNNKLKADCQIEHHRHRSLWNFLVNLVSGIVAYAYDSCKPTIQLTRKEKQIFLSKIIVHNEI